MAKMVLVDGVPHRMRRGKLVPIPKEWVGRHTTPKTIRQRKRTAEYRRRHQTGGNVKGSGSK